MRTKRVVWVSLLGILALALAGCDWPQLRFGPNHLNANPYEPALNETSVQHLKVAWSMPCTCAGSPVGVQPPLVAGGLVYAMESTLVGSAYDSTLHVFDASSGAPKWTHNFGALASAVAVANGLLFVTVNHFTTSGYVGNGELQTLEATAGGKWFTLTPPRSGNTGALVVDAVVDGPTAFVAASVLVNGGGGSDTTVSAVDTGGRVKWFTTPAGQGESVFVEPAAHTVYLDSSEPTSFFGTPVLTGLNEADGRVKTDVVENTHIPGSNAAANGLVYGSNYPLHGGQGIGAFALHPDTGQLAWNNGTALDAVTPSVAIVENYAGIPYLLGLDPITGAARWSQQTGSTARPVVAGDLFFVSEIVSNAPVLVARRLSDGSTVASFDLGVPGEIISSIIPAEGRLYLAGSHTLYALTPAS